ncbi:MAG: cohesin domain-containing protein [Candidatus Marinimicrobia bacterium]|nr:cohesin domain-containing protein [Candidatus Neomarinimicrobiota bacterium]
MNKSIISISLLFLLLFTGCGLFSGGTPTVSMSNLDSTFVSGETIGITVNVEDMKRSIFAMSLRIIYDSEYVGFDDNQSDWIGSIWSDGAIGILKDENSTVYISITEIAGSNVFKPYGTVLSLDFTLKQSGSTQIDFIDDQIFFYDKNGTEINLSDINVEGLSITIQ